MFCSLVILLLFSIITYLVVTMGIKVCMGDIQPTFMRRVTILASVPIILVATFIEGILFSLKETITNLALIW